MSTYFDHQVQTPHDATYKHEHIDWHPKFPLLAVSSFNEAAGGEVNVFFEEGEKTRDTPLRKPTHRVSHVRWHPSKKILAVGWSNGDVTVWNQVDKGEIFAVSPSPGNDITCLEWSSEGSRLIMADSTGLVLVYKTDHRGCPQAQPFSKSKLKEPIKCCVLRPPIEIATSSVEQAKQPQEKQRRQSVSIEGIGEDGQDALDDFGMKRNVAAPAAPPPQASRVKMGSSESWTFFLGGATGGVYCLLSSGVAEECFAVDRAVVKLLYYKERDVLLTVSEDLMLSQHKVSDENTVQELAKVKLSGKPQNLNIIWLEPGILAMSSMESHVRLWDLDNEDNCILSLSNDRGYSTSDTVTCIAHCSIRSILAAGTTLGNIAMWRPNKSPHVPLDQRWKLQLPSTLQSPVAKLKWALSASTLAVCTASEVFVLKEQIMCTHTKHGLVAIQTGQKLITLTKVEQLSSVEYKPDMALKGVVVNQQHMCCWDGHKIAVYEIVETGNGALIGSFACTSQVVALFGQNLYTAEPGRIQVRTFQGTVKQSLPLADEENDPCCMDVGGNFLAVGTTTGFLRIYDLSRREAKQQYHPKYIAEGIKDFGTITSVRINSSGNRVCFILKKGDASIDQKMYVWEAESDTILFYDFGAGRSDQEEYELDDSKSGNSGGRFSESLLGRQPTNAYWDSNDSRLLFCEATIQANATTQTAVNQEKAPMNGERAESTVASFFVTPEHGILLQDAFEISQVCEKLLGAETPYVYFTRKSEFVGDSNATDGLSSTEKSISRYVIRRTCRDFVGLEEADKTTKEAMLNFSFYVTIGNMDEAFKAIKLIKSESVWENMAQMCVKTQRLDVAAVCLGNMGNARAARMLRKASNHSTDIEAKVGSLAVQLGMLDDGVRLFQSCKRYDLCNRIEQATNNWKKAIEIGDKLDRVHLRNSFYNYAKHLEAVGAIQGAIEYYEKSDTHRFEVPRMLFENPGILEQYVKKNKDPYLQRWWAQYLESLGEMEAAKNFYSSAKDYLSVVRLSCYLGDSDQAAKIANESNDKAACYHLARQYENGGQYKEAVHFFTKAKAYGSAIRLCKEHGMDDQIAHLALMSSPADMIEAAKFYENKRGHADKAVMLYHKAKMVARALDLAFRTEQFSALDLIAAELDASADPLVLERCAEFFMQNQQYTKAVQLLAYAKKHGEAIELCIRRNVPITEQLAELLTPTKEAIPDNARRSKLLEQLADCCMQQGHYHNAAKKYTQAGSKTQAMRALLKSGDTEKIVFFANTARTKEIYIMAGNYLQTLDWKQDPEIMKHIVTFYSKGQAPESLASFYDACAQIEIDDYRDYEKALTALQEASESLNRGKATTTNTLQVEQKTAEINRKIALIKQFLGIRETYESDPVEAMKHLQDLSEIKNVNDAVRLGDIYAVLIIHNVKKENYKKAQSYFEDLRKRLPKLDVHRHLKPQVIERIYKQLNLPIPKMKGAIGGGVGGGTEQANDEYVPEASSLKRKMETGDNGMMINE